MLTARKTLQLDIIERRRILIEQDDYGTPPKRFEKEIRHDYSYSDASDTDMN